MTRRGSEPTPAERSRQVRRAAVRAALSQDEWRGMAHLRRATGLAGVSLSALLVSMEAEGLVESRKTGARCRWYRLPAESIP